MVVKLTILAAALALAACGGPRIPAYTGPGSASAQAPASAPAQAPAPGQARILIPPPPVAEPAPQPIVLTDAEKADAKAIKFSRLLLAFGRGDRFGEARIGAACGTPVALTWKGDESFISDKEAARTFYAELAKANYPVADNPEELFPVAPDPDFLMAGRITNMNISYCEAAKDEGSGENSITIEWQLFDLLSRRTIYKARTTGTMRVTMVVPDAEHRLVYGAVADATRALLADPNFHALIASKGDLTPPVVTTSFRLHPRPAFAGAIVGHMAEIQAATVTILLAGAHGSGFVVSSDGYLLTNAHVVGDAKFVRVRLATGRQIAGEVVAVNRRRDVALVKVAETGLVALPLATGEAPVGSEIYAVGAPREVSLATTVTRGIVSAYRVREGQRMIQGDVTVQHGNSGGPLIDTSGNVIGMSATGLLNNDFSAGLNFFIPIAEGLRAVGIEVGEARAASPMRVLERQVAVALQPGRPKPLPTPQPDRPAAAPPGPPADPAPASAAVVADASPQVASLAPAAIPAKRDGDYRAKFTATTINGQSYVDLAISVDGETIRGVGRTRGGLQCRATGEIAADGTAWINVACSNAGSAFLSWQLSGRFAPEKDGTVYVGRLAYANLSGTPGEAVFVQ